MNLMLCWQKEAKDEPQMTAIEYPILKSQKDQNWDRKEVIEIEKVIFWGTSLA